MYQSITLGAVFATSFLQQFVAGQFVGTIVPVGTETGGLIMVTIENNSTGNYSIDAQNNIFDDANPYQPLTVKTLAGKIVTLVGSSATYPPLDDSDFITMSPGAVWQRELNLTEYIPVDATLKVPTSECFSVSFPENIFAVNATNLAAGEDLATAFFAKGDSAYIFIEGPPLHLNITVMPGSTIKAATATLSAEPVGTQPAAQLVQGTDAPGVGGAAPSAGSSIDDYTFGSTSLFGPHKD